MDVKSRIVNSAPLLAILVSFGAAEAAGPKTVPKPDFTRGDEIPNGANHDWTLGPTGLRGWMYSEKLVTSDARQIAITKVEKDSPADGILAVGDVILGVGGNKFAFDPRTEFGRAITAAESESGGGTLSLIRWRAGKTDSATLKLQVLGGYSSTAPYNCAKSQRILKQGCRVLAGRVADPAYRQNPITRSLNALALLASGDPEYLPLVKKEAQWAANYSAEGFQTWYYGYVIMLLSEYVMATGDDSVMPGLERLALEAAHGQSIVGSWGHRFAQPDGRLGGYGMMNAPGLPLTIALILAREAGVEQPEVERAIEKSARLIGFYAGKGAVPYGDHHPWIQTHEDNGKCGMAAVMFNLLGEADAAEFFARMSVASHGAERDTGHTGNFFNLLWSLPGVAQCGPHATGVWMQEFGGWYFDLARRWDGTFLHQGPPAIRKDRYGGWDCTGAYLLAYALPQQTLYLTGKRKSSFPSIDASTAGELINDGRGWSNKDRDSFYDKMSTDQLLAHLSSWSPVVRQRAAIALGRRKDDVAGELIRLLDAPNIETRYGACQAITVQRGRSASAVPALTRTLRASDLWLRIKAADALAAIGEPAKAAVPAMLARLAKGDPENDPRNMEQRYLCFALFAKRGGLISRSLEGVDRELLLSAVRAGLQNEDGRARGSLSTVYQNLSYEEIKPLLPAIHEAIVQPSPSGIMFASGIRLAGVELLAKHRIQEGIPLCIEIIEIQKWGKRDRLTRCLKTLGQYGAAAKPVLPQLRQLEQELLAHREARALRPQIDQLRNLVKEIENATTTVQLRNIDSF